MFMFHRFFCHRKTQKIYLICGMRILIHLLLTHDVLIGTRLKFLQYMSTFFSQKNHQFYLQQKLNNSNNNIMVSHSRNFHELLQNLFFQILFKWASKRTYNFKFLELLRFL